jgi:hypothetical protein
MKAWIRVAAIAACLTALTLLILLLVQPKLDPAKIQQLPLIAAMWLAFVVAAFLLRKTPVHLALPLILVGAFAVQIAALSAPPAQSSDLYRYIWDGRVQAAGIDPYAYTPGDKALVSLRNEFLWSGTGARHYGGCVTPSADTADPARDQIAGCSRMNRVWAPTIYPPVAEAYFLAVQVAVPADTSSTPIQAAAAACALATTIILLFGLAKLGKDIRWAALWAWCPTVALEAGNNAHVDILAVMLTALALLILAGTRSRGRTVLGGVVLGLAIATKMTPGLALPAVVRRSRWLALVASVATAVVVVYVPHVIAVGSRVLGFLPGYLQQEGYTSGTRFGLLDVVFKDKVASGLAVLIIAGTAYLVFRYSDPGRPWHGALIMTGVALAVATPLYQWYALLLVMLVVLDGQPEWLGLAAGGYVFAEPLRGPLALPNPEALGYGAGLAVVLAGVFIRYRLGRPSQPVYRLALTPRAAVPVPPRPATTTTQVPTGTSTPSGSIPSPEAEPADTYLAAGTSAGA